MIPRPAFTPMLKPRVETIQTQGKQEGTGKTKEPKMRRRNCSGATVIIQPKKEESKMRTELSSLFPITAIKDILITRTPERGKFWD